MQSVGVAWLGMMSSLTVATQTASPAWARVLGIYLLVFQGAMAAGSFAWGALAERLGNGTVLLLAALTLIGGLAATLRWPLHAIQRLDLSPSGHWPDPALALYMISAAMVLLLFLGIHNAWDLVTYLAIEASHAQNRSGE